MDKQIFAGFEETQHPEYDVLRKSLLVIMYPEYAMHAKWFNIKENQLMTQKQFYEIKNRFSNTIQGLTAFHGIFLREFVALDLQFINISL